MKGAPPRGSAADAAQAYADALSALGRQLGAGWQVLDWQDRAMHWRFFSPHPDASQAHGWKVHASAAASEAFALLRALAPVARRLHVPFKLPRNVDAVVLLNSGDAGATQMGKVATFYPGSAALARALLTALDAAWPSSQGPEVLTDWQWRRGAAVSFRYGVFRATDETVDSRGMHHLGWRAADGSVHADERVALPADAVPDPNGPAPEAVAPSASRIAIHQPFALGGREWLPLTELARSPRTVTWLAADLERLETVVVKLGRRGAAGDAAGTDIRDLMAAEYRALHDLREEPGIAPRALAFEPAPDPVLVLSDFRGTSLAALPRGEAMAALPALASVVARIHAQGCVHGDVKLDNAVRHDSGIGLIDFELACRVGSPMRAGGTPGHLDPAIAGRGVQATTARDVYALGGCLVHAWLGVPPGLFPPGRGAALLDNEGASAAARLVRRAQAPDAVARPSAAALADALRALEAEPPVARRARAGRRRRQAEFSLARWCRRAAVDAAAACVGFAEGRELGHCWRNEHFQRAHDCEGLNLGAAGIVLGLLAVGQAAGTRAFDDAAASGAAWLASRRPDGQAAGPFTGNAGVALALAAAGRRFGEPALLRAAKARLQHALADHRELDLFSGLAGSIWSACLLHGLLGDESPLDAAAGAVQHLRTRQVVVDGTPAWRTDTARDAAFHGCAHGAAGIAMALACWSRASGDRAALDTARETWTTVYARGRSADGRALRIAADDDRVHAAGNWCHGVGGYLWSMLNSIGDDPALRVQIDWAAACVDAVPAAGTPTYCHGLAGQLELARMLRRSPRFASSAEARAQKLARALRCLHVRHAGHRVWPSDEPTIVTPDLWIGFLGPATALARHAADLDDALLSVDGLRGLAGVA